MSAEMHQLILTVTGYRRRTRQRLQGGAVVTTVVVIERRGDKLVPLAINERVAWLYSLNEGQEIDADMRNLLIGAASAYDLGVSDERQRATRIISGDRP